MRLKLVPESTSINFLKFYRLAFVLSSLLVAGSIGLFAIIGLNLGIDFKGGILIEARHNTGPANISGLRDDLESLGLGDISLQGFGTETFIAWSEVVTLGMLKWSIRFVFSMPWYMHLAILGDCVALRINQDLCVKPFANIGELCIAEAKTNSESFCFIE